MKTHLAVAALWLAGASAAAACEAGQSCAPAIQVETATYGGNCRAPAGNETKVLGAACDGREECEWEIDYHRIGDPARGCQKDFTAAWDCGDGKRRVARVAPEAGFDKIVTLDCR